MAVKILQEVEISGISTFGSSSDPALYIDSTNKKVGFRTNTPGAAFDVNGTMRVRNQLNVGNTTEQNLYVDGSGTAGGKYVKMGNYGGGNYFGSTGNENQPKYTSAFGNGGKIVEDSRLVTIKLTGEEGQGWSCSPSSPKTLISSPGNNSILVPREILIYRSSSNSGEGWSAQGNVGVWIGNVNGSVYAEHFVVPLEFCKMSATGFWAGPGPLAWPGGFATNWRTSWDMNKALMLGTMSTVAGQGDWYIQLRYSVINVTAGITGNVDITVN
jgi:hypothetical protein